jgi:hypothetical protein
MAMGIIDWLGSVRRSPTGAVLVPTFPFSAFTRHLAHIV